MKSEYCLISLAFLGASFYTMMADKTHQPFLKYEKSLTSPQKAMYDYIVYERTKLYIQGLILGIVFGALYMYFFKQGDNIKNSPFKHSCIITSIVLATQYFYYTLAPKKVHMLNILNKREQIDNWLEVYNTMKFRYHIGMLLGIVGFFLLSYGFIR